MDPSAIIRVREMSVSILENMKVQEWLNPNSEQTLKIKIKTTVNKSFDLTKLEYSTLRNTVTLCDTIVNIYFGMLQQRENETSKSKKCLFLGHSFSQAVFALKPDIVLEMDIFQSSVIFFPLKVADCNWFLCSADMANRTLSFHGLNNECDFDKWSNAIFKWFTDSVRGLNIPFVSSQWTIVDFTLPGNTFDSGVYILMSADFLSSEGDRVLYDAEQVTKFRNVLLVDISRGHFGEVNSSKRAIDDDTKAVVSQLLTMKTEIR
jgi:Ulp1 family protease